MPPKSAKKRAREPTSDGSGAPPDADGVDGEAGQRAEGNPSDEDVPRAKRGRTGNDVPQSADEDSDESMAEREDMDPADGEQASTKRAVASDVGDTSIITGHGSDNLTHQQSSKRGRQSHVRVPPSAGTRARDSRIEQAGVPASNGDLAMASPGAGVHRAVKHKQMNAHRSVASGTSALQATAPLPRVGVGRLPITNGMMSVPSQKQKQKHGPDVQPCTANSNVQNPHPVEQHKGSLPAKSQGSPERGVSPTRIRRIADGADGVGIGGNGQALGTFGKATAMFESFALKVGRLSPDLNTSKALQLVKNTALNMLLVLAVLCGTCLLWRATLKAVAIGSTPANGAGEKVLRAAARSIVLSSEPMQSLEGVLAERASKLLDLTSKEAEIRVALGELQETHASIADKMDLLRAQAQTGIASRGLEENPEASEEVLLSQMSELQKMRDIVEERLVKTRDAVEAGKQWTEQEAASSAEASTRGEHGGAVGHVPKEVEQALVEPFSAVLAELDSLSSVLDRTEEAISSKLQRKEIEEIVQQVKDASAASSAGVTGPELEGRVTKAVALQLQDMRNSGGQEVDLVDHGDRRQEAGEMEQVIESKTNLADLVAEEIEIFLAGCTGKPDYASLRSGASVVHGPMPSSRSSNEDLLTSPSLAQSVLPWSSYVLHLLRLPGYTFASGADAALSMSNTLGSCFAFHGGKGRLTVRLAPSIDPTSQDSSIREGGAHKLGETTDSAPGFVKVTHVAIEHARTRSAPSAVKSAPRKFRVIGWEADPKIANGDSNGHISVHSPHVLIEEAEFRSAHDSPAPGVQTFRVTPGVGEESPPVGWVTLEIESNYGGEWTCLYGLRVHGNPYEQT